MYGKGKYWLGTYDASAVGAEPGESGAVPVHTALERNVSVSESLSFSFAGRPPPCDRLKVRNESE